MKEPKAKARMKLRIHEEVVRQSSLFTDKSCCNNKVEEENNDKTETNGLTDSEPDVSADDGVSGD